MRPFRPGLEEVLYDRRVRVASGLLKLLDGHQLRSLLVPDLNCIYLVAGIRPDRQRDVVAKQRQIGQPLECHVLVQELLVHADPVARRRDPDAHGGAIGVQNVLTVAVIGRHLAEHRRVLLLDRLLHVARRERRLELGGSIQVRWVQETFSAT